MSPARFRRMMIAGIAGICTATGPMALPATAAADPALVLSATSVRAGVPFTVTSTTACPSDGGEQTVQFSFTDSDDTSTDLGSVQTDENGAWSTSLSLPTAGPDGDDAWQDSPVAAGAGTLSASCTTPSDGDDPDDDGLAVAGAGSTNSTLSTPADDDDPGDDAGDDGSEITQSYADATMTVRAAAQVSIAPAVVAPGSAVTVTPGEACVTGATRVHVGVVELGEDGNDGDDPDDGDDRVSDTTGVDAYAAVTGGTWSPVSVTPPAGSVTGDYAVTVDCLHGDSVVSSYDAEPLAVGTITVGTPVCTSRGAAVRVAGTYEESVTVHGRRDASMTIPHTFRFAGDGPWTLTLNSTTTDLRLLRQTVTCPPQPYDLNVPKTGLNDNGRPQARVCNSGTRSVDAVLQLAKGARFRSVDDEQLAPGDCTWLSGGRLGRGDDARARVLLNAPGSSRDDVVASFSVHRGRH